MRDWESSLTVTRLKELFHYNPETGVFTNLRPRSYRRGDMKAPHKGRRYIAIVIDGRLYVAHRLAWLYVYGELPHTGIDHINGNRIDNRIENLRLATSLENSQNMSRYVTNKSGYKGVSSYGTRGKWSATIYVNKKRIILGYFNDIQQAAHEYNKAAIKYFGEFARLNPIGVDK